MFNPANIVLDSVINHPENLDYVLSLLVPQDFESTYHQEVFTAVWDCYLAEVPVDLVNISKKVKKFNYENMDRYYFDGCNLEYYVQQVKEASEKRNFQKYLVEAHSELKKEDSNFEDIRRDLLKNLQGFTGIEKIDNIKNAEQQIAEYETRLKAIQGNCLVVGIDLIDMAIRGIAGGEVLIILARAGSYKTAFWQQLLKNYVTLSGLAAIGFSLEMPTASLVERYLSMQTGEPGRVVEMNYGDINAEFVRTAKERYIREMRNLYFVDSNIKLHEIAQYKSLVENKYHKTVGAIGIDYLGMIDSDDSKIYERISNISRNLKKTSKALNIPFVVICQTGRTGGDGYDEINMSMARDSGVVDESGDTILGIWQDREDESILYFKICKNRKGPKDRIFTVNINRSNFRFGTQATVYHPEQKKEKKSYFE